MATKKKTEKKERLWLIDPVYRKFTAKAMAAMTGSDFYEFFQTMQRNGEHTFQFSNRKINIDVDEEWVKIIEETIPPFLEITRNPRVIITQEELVTNVVQARRIDSTVVRHLCSHSYLVDSYDEETGDVTPSKVLNIFKEETWNTYENRFVYTLLVKTYAFVKKRYEDMKEAMNGEFGATLKIDSAGHSGMEEMSVNSVMKIKQFDDFTAKAKEKDSIFARIQYIYEALSNLMVTRFAKEMKNYPVVKPPLVQTNAIKKNPFLRKCNRLWQFLLTYFETGFVVTIIEQNPEINKRFENDIFNNIMFTYIILKGYLEDNRDRALDKNVKSRRRYLRPRYIQEIIEQLVMDYNIPKVEVRKILIEELTKEELMREEREERYRLVDELRKQKERERKEKELEALRKFKEEERERKREARERLIEQKRLLREKAKEEERLERERARKHALDLKRGDLFKSELEKQLEAVEKRRIKEKDART